MQRLSEYANNLPSDAKARYVEKLDFIGGIDPFQTANVGELDDHLPDVDASDLVSYLVLQTSFVTAKQFKARKGLEAYQFISGWVKDVYNRKVHEKHLITARVSYFVAIMLYIVIIIIHLLICTCMYAEIMNMLLLSSFFTYLRYDIHRE